MYIEIYLYVGNNRKKSELDTPRRQPTTPGATLASQGGGRLAKVATTRPTWQVPPPA